MNLSKHLPFYGCSPFSISQTYLTNKNKILDDLESNNFSENMLNLVNGFSKDNYTCGYFQEESINNLAKNHLPHCLKIFHLNIVSFNKNGSNLAAYLKCLKFKFDIICLTEIRENNLGIIENEFQDYHIHIDNPQKSNGGVALLLRKSKFEQINDLTTNLDLELSNKCKCKSNFCQIENKWLKFKINDQEIILGGIYRHPSKGKIDCFNEALKKSLDSINRNTMTIILGDMNINLLLEDKEFVETYLNNFLSRNYIPLITLPTRINKHSASLIDHIFVKIPPNLIQNKCSSGNLITDLSDHLPNFSLINIQTPSLKNRPYVRIFSEEKINLFNEQYVNEPDLINDSDLINANHAYSTFSTNYINLFNKYFPFRRLSQKELKHKPYISSGIIVSIRSKNKLHRKFLDNPTDVNEAIWKNFRNKTNLVITRAKEKYYKSILRSHNNSSANLWKTFGKILNKKKIKHKRTISLNIDGTKISDTQRVTELFNKHFCEIGKQLARNFPSQNTTEFMQYLGNPAPQSIYLYSISESDIINTIRSMKNTSSAGHDEFSSKFIKLSLPILVPALEKIFNLALNSGVYPDELKIAKVIPIFKKGSPNSINNYRPISILSSINKIFEKILYSRLISYIDQFKLLYKYQFGFRKNHSTEQSLIEFVDQIRSAMDNQHMTCGIFIDLSKAFDTVDHQILISKLEHYGIRGSALELFKSYLTNRNQYVQIDKFKSQTLPINCGVPQGSVLGPLLFLLFINDLPNCCTIGNFRIFADDTNVFFQCKTADELITQGQNIMISLNSWFKHNKMTLNVDKTSFTIFKSNRLKINNLPNQINFLDTKITRSPHVKFLGMILDENLTWDHHISEICNKLKSLFHIFYNIRDYLSKQDIKTLYYSLIYSRIKYGITLYGQATKKQVRRVQILQNQLLKVLGKNEFKYSTDTLHSDYDLLKVNDITKHETLTFVHKYHTNCLPPVFDNYFVSFSHNYNTRFGSQSYIIDNHASSAAALSVKIVGVKLWNQLDNDLKLIPTRKKFRNKLKISLLS